MLKYLSLLWALWWSLPTYCVKQKYWHTIYFHILRFWKLSPPSRSLLPPGPVSSFSYHFLFFSRPTSLLGGTFQWVQSRNQVDSRNYLLFDFRLLFLLSSRFLTQEWVALFFFSGTLCKYSVWKGHFWHHTEHKAVQWSGLFYSRTEIMILMGNL